MPKAPSIDKQGPSGGKSYAEQREFFFLKQANAWKIWTESVRRNRISHPLINSLVGFGVPPPSSCVLLIIR